MKIILIKSRNGVINQVFVDDEDFDFLNQWKWFIHVKTYAGRWNYTNDKKTLVLMHRVINKTKKGFVTDHIDGNGLNNQKTNLRTATISQNAANIKAHKNSTSKYLGIYLDKKRNKWFSTITKNQKPKFLGRFDNEIDAAKAYDKAALELHGEFANLNFGCR